MCFNVSFKIYIWQVDLRAIYYLSLFFLLPGTHTLVIPNLRWEIFKSLPQYSFYLRPLDQAAWYSENCHTPTHSFFPPIYNYQHISISMPRWCVSFPSSWLWLRHLSLKISLKTLFWVPSPKNQPWTLKNYTKRIFFKPYSFSKCYQRNCFIWPPQQPWKQAGPWGWEHRFGDTGRLVQDNTAHQNLLIQSSVDFLCTKFSKS